MAAKKAPSKTIARGCKNSQSANGAEAAATIELNDTSRVGKTTAAKIATNSKPASGAMTRSEPSAVATPLPPRNFKNTG